MGDLDKRQSFGLFSAFINFTKLDAVSPLAFHLALILTAKIEKINVVYKKNVNPYVRFRTEKTDGVQVSGLILTEKQFSVDSPLDDVFDCTCATSFLEYDTIPQWLSYKIGQPIDASDIKILSKKIIVVVSSNKPKIPIRFERMEQSNIPFPDKFYFHNNEIELVKTDSYIGKFNAPAVVNDKYQSINLSCGKYNLILIGPSPKSGIRIDAVTATSHFVRQACENLDTASSVKMTVVVPKIKLDGIVTDITKFTKEWSGNHFYPEYAKAFDNGVQILHMASFELLDSPNYRNELDIDDSCPILVFDRPFVVILMEGKRVVYISRFMQVKN